MASYLVQRGEIFYFRRAVPLDLQVYFPFKQLWISLRTKNKKLAKTRARCITGQFEELTFKIRSGLMQPEEIKAAIQKAFQKELQEMESAKCRPSAKGDSTFLHGELPHIFAEKITELKRMLHLEQYDDSVMSLAVGRIIWQQELRIEHGTPEYYSLYRGYIIARLELYERLLREERGDFSQSPSNITSAQFKEITGERPQVAAEPKSQKQTELLSDAIEKFITQQEIEGGISTGSMDEYAQAYRVLPAVIGDKAVSEVTRDDVRTFLDTLKKLPSRMNTLRLTKGKSIPEVLDIANKNKMSLLSPKSIGKKFQRVKAFLRWATQEGYNETDLCTGIDYKEAQNQKKKKDECRLAYSLNDLQGMVKGLLTEREKGTFKKHPERYWIPLIALFSGCRLEEICQLHVEDVVTVDGVWCLHVTPDEDEEGNPIKSVKAAASKRLVPIHPCLENLGFLDFYQCTIVEEKQPRLWMALKRDCNEKYKRNFGDWYNGADRRPGFENVYIDDDKRKTFHSTRHTFATALKHLLIDERVVNELLGHTQKTLGSGTYGKVFPPAQLLDALKDVVYGVNFVGQLGRWPW